MSRSPRSRFLRIVLPAVVILAWFTLASIGGPYFGKVDEVSSNDATTYLPSSADATAVQQRLGDFLGTDSLPAVVVVESDATLSQDQLTKIGDALSALDGTEGIGTPSPAIPSDDGLAAQAFVPIAADAELSVAVDALNTALDSAIPSGATAFVTGPAGFAHDLVGAFAGIDGILLLVALAAVLVILIVVYRSLLLPVAVLATSMFALCVALLTVWHLANAGVLLLSGQTQGILFILVIGAATDYALLFVARYRDELTREADKGRAVLAAWKGSFEPIIASGGTVIAGLLCLLFSDLRSNSALGPVAAIGIVFSVIAALTLLPALLFAFGRASFWPRVPRVGMPVDPERGVWARVGRLVSRRPRTIWIATTVLLALGCLGVTQLQADGVAQSDLVLTSSPARDGQSVLGEHFPAGSGSPAQIIVPEGSLQEAAEVLLADGGIASVAVVADTPSGTAAVTADGITPFAGQAAAPVVSDGEVLLQATLTDAADSAGAEETIRSVRQSLDEAVPGALVGGTTATDVDTNDASIHDRTLIIPLILGVIMLILMALLRSILAPVLLIITTVLSFGTAMGVSALVFNGIFGFPGADPAVPLFGFVFLVALGIDYNIFLMTRVREESLTHGTREGVLRGLRITGGVITSAGVVLAATFTALAVIPVLFLVQLAFIVAFGVLLDTLVVRSLLVPALSTDLGKRIWWPSRLGR